MYSQGEAAKAISWIPITSLVVLRTRLNVRSCSMICRRTFLTMAERLGFSYVILKKLANHSGRNDTTFGYIVVDIERLREPMQRITIEFLLLCKDRSRSSLTNDST